MKKAFKIFFVLLIILFLGLYFAYHNGYYEKLNMEKKILTDNMILEYEQDLKKGIDVTKKEYVVVKPSYANVYTQTFLKISKKIEDSFNATIKYFFRKINDTIDS